MTPIENARRLHMLPPWAAAADGYAANGRDLAFHPPGFLTVGTVERWVSGEGLGFQALDGATVGRAASGSGSGLKGRDRARLRASPRGVLLVHGLAGHVDAVRQLLADRSVGDLSLPPGWMVCLMLPFHARLPHGCHPAAEGLDAIGAPGGDPR